jgi:nucleotide-binding universal stress UspA family protein
MEDRLLHVFRNTPFGRETFLQSLYFCKVIGVIPHVYIPESTQFLLYFDHDAVQVDLDKSYLTSPATAAGHVAMLALQSEVIPVSLVPKNFTASQLPDLPTNFNYMCCPRSISDLSAKIGLGYIGPKVRRISKSAAFPVLLTSGVFKPWKSITVFYGGSQNANKALRWGLHLHQKSGYPLDMFTYTKNHDPDYFEQQLKDADLLDAVHNSVRTWNQIADGVFEEHLYTVPHDALLVVGTYGHSLIKEFLFGSKMEAIQSWMPNNILLIGPHCILGAV